MVALLARAAREDPAPAVRQRAIALISRFKTPEVKGVLLLAHTADPDAKVRQAAKKALSRMPRRLQPARLTLKPLPFKRPKKVDDAAVRRALALPSGDARMWAVRVLGYKKKLKRRTQLLARHLAADPSARVRARCAESLVKLGGKRALPRLVKAASDADPTVRFAVARLMARFDDAGALRVLQRMATADTDATVRAEVRDLLEPTTAVGRRLLRQRIAQLSSSLVAQRIAAIKALSKFTKSRAMKPMACALLRDKSVKVRAVAAKVLANKHDVSVLTALRVAAVIEPDAKQKKRVRALLGTLRRRVDQLIRQLQRGDKTARRLAARALGQAAYPPGLKPLIAALRREKSARVRRAVARALTNFEHRKALAALRRAAADRDREVRKIVAYELKRQRRFGKWRAFYRATTRVVERAGHKDPTARVDAALALGVAAAEAGAKKLIRLLQRDKDERVRLAAAWALVLLGTDAGDKALRRAAAKDRSQRVRLAARKYLYISKVSLSDLIAQLGSSNATTRVDAAEALSLRPTRRALQPLVKAAMCDPKAGVRAAALRGLARIGNRFARGVLRSAMARDASARVRRSAMVMYILAGGK